MQKGLNRKKKWSIIQRGESTLKKRLGSLFLALLLCVSTCYGCDKTAILQTDKDQKKQYEQVAPESIESDHTLGGTKEKEKEQKAFDTWCQEQFVDSMEDADTVSIHYMMQHPENYGVTEPEVSFGELSVEQMKKDAAQNEQCQKELATFDYHLLDEEQQVTYDVLHYYLQLGEESSDFYYYSTLLSPDLGIPANVPVELAEFPLRTKEDVQTYLTLLTKLPEYFTQLAAYEKEVSKQGLFISDVILEDTLKQMQNFIAKPDENYLITTFAQRLADIDGLSQKEQKAFAKTNEEYVKQYVITAYEQLIKEIKALQGTGKNTGGLCHLEKGKEYYEYLTKYYTCSDMTVEEVWKILKERIETLMNQLTEITMKDYTIFDDVEKLSYPTTDPEQMLVILQQAIKDYYPECPKVEYTLKHVDESQAESLSPAFYMVPQIDNYKDNVIYINDKNSNFDINDLFPTMAHEGFPGHLYQTTYYHSTQPEPIRQLLNFGGYSEGWATYVELSSYELVDFGEKDKLLTDFCQVQSELSLALSSIADIGINYKGWDEMELQKYLKEFGMGDTEIVKEVSKLVIENPGNYLQYYVSYLEFWNLRCKAKHELGKQFSSKEFHKAVLDCGPAPFSVVEQQVDAYITQKKAQN